MKAHEENACRIAQSLQAHPKVEAVLYPGLESHPQYDLACRQMSGFGGMISIYLKGGMAQVKRLLDRLHIFTLAESLGGVESLVSHPATMTHASLSPTLRRSLGITDNLLRLSVGIESAEDLLRDLDHALG